MAAPTARTGGTRVRLKDTDMYVNVIPPSQQRMGDFDPYSAAGQGRRAKTWRPSSAGPNASISFAHPTLVSRSRDATRKNPYAESAIRVNETNLVGTGIRPQFNSPDAGLNSELLAIWQDWCEEADADGQLSWYGLEGLAARSMAEAGECFGRFRVRRAGEMSTVPLQIQLLETEFVPIDRNEARPGRTITSGVEFNLVGRRMAYWMYRQHPNDLVINSGVFDNEPRPVPASEVMHIREVRRPGQIRGEPWLTRDLIKMRDLDSYDDAEVVRKKITALFAGFVTSPEDFGWEGDRDDDEEGVVTLEPGIMQELEPGQDITFSSPTEVGGSYEPFMRQQLRAIAVGAGILYEQLTGDYSKVNDRTFRASVNEFRRRMEMLQQNLIVFQMCRPTVNRWIDLAVLSGVVRLPRTLEARDLYRVEWVPQGWAYINPVQDIQAARDEVRAGFTSRQRIVSKRGHDVEQIDREIAEDNARADESELVFDSDARKTSSAGQSQAGETDEREPADNQDGDEANEERENA